MYPACSQATARLLLPRDPLRISLPADRQRSLWLLSESGPSVRRLRTGPDDVHFRLFFVVPGGLYCCCRNPFFTLWVMARASTRAIAFWGVRAYSPFIVGKRRTV